MTQPLPTLTYKICPECSAERHIGDFRYHLPVRGRPRKYQLMCFDCYQQAIHRHSTRMCTGPCGRRRRASQFDELNTVCNHCLGGKPEDPLKVHIAARKLGGHRIFILDVEPRT